jgi:AraC family transcriptional regulator, glycine betaine-responsive activator
MDSRTGADGRDRAQGSRTDPLCVGFLTLANFSMIAFANAVEPLRMANRLSGTPFCVWKTISLKGEPVRASNGLALEPTVASANAGEMDIVFVCGGIDIKDACDGATLAYLRRVSRGQVKLGALCTGAYVLARAGLVDGYRCAIHWENMAAVREEFPKVKFSTELFVIDRDRYTASGGTAPLDLMLNLIASRGGRDLAVAISQEFIHERIRESTDQQFISLLARFGVGHQRITDAARLMEEHIDAPLSLDGIARKIGITRRQMERLFIQHLDLQPSRYYRELRLNRARQLLRQTSMSLTEISIACGFQTSNHFSTSYRKMFGQAPSAERQPSRLRE